MKRNFSRYLLTPLGIKIAACGTVFEKGRARKINNVNLMTFDFSSQNVSLEWH